MSVPAAFRDPLAPLAQPTVKVITPQPGFQTAFLSTAADVAIGGGAAGASKTYGLLMEATRHTAVPGFGAVIFRRESPQITNQGGMWDDSHAIYAGMGALPNQRDLSWTFHPRTVRTRIRFSHMQLETDRFAWDGSQVPLLGFDQLEHFHESQFWYLFSRNRSTCGVAPYIRATCNPVLADDEVGGWLHRLVQWWIDDETGYPIKERGGVVRWMLRVQDEVVWGDSRDGLIEQYRGEIPEPDLLPKSFTFLPGTLADNPALTSKDPGYRASLLAMPYVERERLLGGNWNVRPEAGKVFNRSWFKVLEARPRQLTALVRYWDKAATEGGGAFSSGALMGRLPNGQFVLLDVTRGQWSSGNREQVIQQVAAGDKWFAQEIGCQIEIWLEQEPGSGGKESAESSVINLAGHVVKTERVTGSKLTRAGPYSAQCEAGNVFLVNPLGAAVTGIAALESYLNEAQNFDGVSGKMDQIDCSSGAFNKLTLMKASVLQGRVTW